MSIQLYEVNHQYIDYLIPHAPHLFHNKQPGQHNERKYIGIVLIVNSLKYFAPLSSFKPKHDNMKDGLDFIKVGNYAVININNMFPVPDGQYTYVDIPRVKDPQYRKLLTTEYRIIRSLQDKIKKNAAEVYKHKIKKGNATALAKRCNDFLRLEEKCRQFKISSPMTKTDFSVVEKNLKDRGYTVTIFETAVEAVNYLDMQIDNQTVGFGGSVTLEQMKLYETLQKHNTVFWHQRIPTGKTHTQVRVEANQAEIYISSVNGLAETGEIINIDNNCNRVASIFYGHKKVYLIVGKNKLEKDYDSALWRARNVASPLNAKRVGAKTPCAVKGGKCYDCKSPERICRGLSVLWHKPMTGEFEVILIHEKLGY